MRISTRAAVYALGAAIGMGAGHGALAQATAPGDATQPQEVVVTAQKRSESINNVGMAITAASGEQLKLQGVQSVDGLTKIDPSFVVAASNYTAPVYSIRGISYNDFAIAATPTVSVYSDEVPYAYPALTKGATYDLDRVEVLKGPQGTLYGQNSTGGAINYVNAKPTRYFAASGEATYGSYGAFNANGYVSGPISETLAARLAVNVDEGGAWQRNNTTGAALGARDSQKARLLLDWKPNDRLSVAVNLNGWIDRSDSQTGQTVGFNPSNAAYVASIPQLAAAIAANNVHPTNARSTNWQAGTHPRLNEHYGQLAARVEYRLADDVLLTYLGSYEAYDQRDLLEPTGSNIEFSLLQAGLVHSNSQEARLSGALFDKKLVWLLGASFEENITSENQLQDLGGTTSAYGFASFLAAAHLPVTPFMATRNVSTDDSRSTAVFANAEYHLTPALDLHAGLRFTSTDISHGGCSKDVGGLGVAGVNAEEAALIAKANAAGAHDTFVPVVANGCTTLGPNLNPIYFQGRLSESNVSWRTGIDWHPVKNTLLYATVSRGYKAGSFPTLSATASSQLAPVVQESIVASEIGVKSRLLGRRLELDADVFYYDYNNKQLAGRIPDPLFKALNVLVNVPRSMEDGAEVAVKVRPIDGLLINLQSTYLNSVVLGDTPGYTGYGVATNFKGATFPDTPRLAVLLDVQYDWRLNNGLSAFVGASDRYRSRVHSQLATYNSPFAPFPSTVIQPYSIVGLRAGVTSNDRHWRAEVFGDNVFNKYYVTHVEKISEVTADFAGRPATYGVTLAYTY